MATSARFSAVARAPSPALGGGRAPARRTRRSTRARDVNSRARVRAQCRRARARASSARVGVRRRRRRARRARAPCGPARPARELGELVGSTRAHAASSSAHPRARVSFLGDVAAATGPSWNLAAQLVLPALGALALAVFSACVAGFLVAVRELVRACREATIASRAVARCADSIDAACAALGEDAREGGHRAGGRGQDRERRGVGA